MPTYILFSGARYYPEGGAGDETVVITATDDESAIDQACDVDTSRLGTDWWRLDRIDGDRLVPVVEEGWVGDAGLILPEESRR